MNFELMNIDLNKAQKPNDASSMNDCLSRVKVLDLLVGVTRPLDCGAASSVASRQGKEDVGRSQR